VHREIANSQAYQRSWRPNETNKLDEKNFSRAVPRRLPAEVMYDAVRQATASDQQIESFGANVKDRAISLPGAGVRANRAGAAAYALTIFGRSTRDSNCDCDRSSEASLLQTVYLQNDREILEMVGLRKDGWVGQAARQLGLQVAANRTTSDATERQIRQLKFQLAAGKKRIAALRQAGNDTAADKLQLRVRQVTKRIAALEPKQPQVAAAQATAADLDGIIQQTFLRTVSRHPTADELADSRSYLQDSEDPVQGLQDLLWALLNTKEFRTNH
jgi:hypothetical protein